MDHEPQHIERDESKHDGLAALAITLLAAALIALAIIKLV